jgi:hypothetical protein
VEGVNVDLTLNLTWVLTETSNGSPAIRASLPGQTRYYALGFSGDKAVSSPDSIARIRDFSGRSVFSGDILGLFAAVMGMGEKALDMTFSVKHLGIYKDTWCNSAIAVTYRGSDGTSRYGEIGPFCYNIKKNFVRVPQYRFDNGKYMDIVTGSLTYAFKSMVEHDYLQRVQNKIESESLAYKRKMHKGKISNKLKKELAAMVPEEGNHNAFCSKCSFFFVSEKDSGGDERVYSCGLGVFAPFNSIDITEDMLEKCGVSSQGEKLKSNRPDAIFSWNDETDKALSLADWMHIGYAIDNESEFGSSMEEHFSYFEFLYDDVLWIEHLHKRGLINDVEDLDELISEHRDALLKRLQKRYSRMFPAYQDLFLQQSSSDSSQQKVVMDMTPEEVTEQAHTVKMETVLDTYILQACGLGYKSVKKEDGTTRNYMHRGYPMPEPDDFGYDVLAKF